MSRPGLTFPPAAERGVDLPAPAEPASGGRWSRPRRRAVCLLSACAGVLVIAGVAGGVIGLRSADRPAGHGYAHSTSAARSDKPAVLPTSRGSAARTLPASSVPAGILPYAPTAAAFPLGNGPGQSTAPRPSPDPPARSTVRSVPPPAYPGRSPAPVIATPAPSPGASSPGPSGSGPPSLGPSGGSSSPGPSGSGSPSATGGA